MRIQQKETSAPSVRQLEAEISKEKHQRQYNRVLRSTVYTLITVAAVAVLLSTLFLPVLRIYGTSMTPTLEEDGIVVSVKGANLRQGDVIAFYFNNKILVKRVIAGPGSWVEMDADGTVYVDGTMLEEPYLEEKTLGDCDLSFPYQVPEGRWFVMGDHRSTSVDSRNTAVGCVAEEQIVGKIVFSVWPLSQFGAVG